MADPVLLWHMHQPDYRHPVSGHSTRPWVLLRAIKDYADMASHLERHGGVRCTINFVPVPLDQIEDYCDQLESGQWRDPLLHILAVASPEQLTPSNRDALVQVAFHCCEPNMVQPHGPFRRLRDEKPGAPLPGPGRARSSRNQLQPQPSPDRPLRPSIPAGAPACRLNSRRHHAPRAAARRGRMTRTVALLFGFRGRWTVPRPEAGRQRTMQAAGMRSTGTVPDEARRLELQRAIDDSLS